jgi:hypothetical protein
VIRDVSRIIAAVAPGCAVLRTPKRTVVSAPIVSTSARPIRDIYQTPGDTTITVETVEAHGFTAANLVSVQADGWDGLTKLAHPANGFSQTIVYVDTTKFIISGSTWVANSFFLSGYVCAGTLTLDAGPALQALSDIAAEDGGMATLSMPNGVVAVLTKQGTSNGLGFRSSITIEGQGEHSSWIVAGPNLDGHLLLWYNDINATVRRITLYGDRQNQGVGGFHLLRFGSDSGTVTYNVTIEDTSLLASPGYGFGGGSLGSFASIKFRNVTIKGADSDGADFKNRTNLNDINYVEGLWLIHVGLYRIGINFTPKRLGNNPITTNGTSIITVAHAGTNFAVGITVTLRGVADFNGLVGPDITGTVVSRNSSGYTLQLTQTATGSSAGGGAAVDAYGAQFSTGDAFFDPRGERWNIDGLHIVGDLQGRVGIRLRRGVIGTSNGTGAHKSNVQNVTVTHTGPLAQQGTGIGIAADDVNIDGLTCYNLSRAVLVNSWVSRASISNVKGYSCNYVVYNDGENTVVSNAIGYDSKAVSFYDDGGELTDSGDMVPNPFTTTAGSAVVTVDHPMHDHVTGNTVTYGDMEPFDNVDLNGSLTVTVIDANSYTVTSATTATAGETGGGENVTYAWAGAVHNAQFAIYNSCQSVGSLKGFETTSRSRDALITASCSDGDTTAYTRNGVRTRLRNNTGALPSLETIVALPTDGSTTTLTQADSGKIYYLPTTAASKATINLPTSATNNDGMKFTFKIKNAVGVDVLSAGSQTVRVGAATSTVGFNCAAAGGALVIEADEQGRWQASSVIETWTAL